MLGDLEPGGIMTAFLINTGAVASERFEDETVLINFERGTYFSLTGSAPAIWTQLSIPRTVADLEQAIVAVAGELSGQDRAALRRLIELLAGEGCLVEAEPLPDAPPAVFELDGPFLPPAVQSFHDLQELIAIDPVHEADAFDGWPHRPPALTLD